jgi:hypothetical protein
MSAKLTYNKSESINYNSEEDCYKYLTEILHNLLTSARVLVSSQSNLCNKIGKAYENGINEFIQRYTPLDAYWYIFKTYEVICEMLECLDFQKILVKLSLMNMKSLNISTKSLVLSMFADDGRLQTKTKSFIENLLNTKLANLFDCFDYALNHPKETLGNAKAFVDNEDDLFN